MPLPQPRYRTVLWALVAGGLGFCLTQRVEASPLGATPAPAAAPKASPVPQIPRPGGWKDCSYNDVVIACIDQQLPQGLRINWKDGLYMVYSETAAPRPGDPPLLRDNLGGLWRRELLLQGNSLLVNQRNGNRILIPLRHPCRHPMQGEVGYCHY